MGKSSLSLRFITALLNVFWRALFPLNIFLFLSAVFLGAFYILIASGEFFNIPNSITERVKKEVDKYGIEVDFSSAGISLNGTVKIEELKMRFSGTPQSFFVANKLILNFSPWAVISGNLEFKSASIFDGSLSQTSDISSDSPVIRNINISLCKQGKWWFFKPSNLRVGRLILHTDGFVSDSFDLSEITEDLCIPKSESQKEDAIGISTFNVTELSKKMDFYLGELEKIVGIFDSFENPSVDLHFRFFGGGSNSATLNFSSGETTFETDILEAKISNFVLKLSYNSEYLDNEKVVAELFVEKFSGKDLPSIENLSARAFFVPDYQTPSFENVNFAAATISFKGFSIDNVSFIKTVLDEKNWGENWFLFAEFGINKIDGELNYNPNGISKFNFNANINPREILKIEELEDIEELKQLAFDNGISIDGLVTFDSLNKAIVADAYFSTHDCIIMNIPVDSATGNIFYSSEKSYLFAENLDVRAKLGWAIKGAMFQDLKNYDYKIYVNGCLRPSDIAHFMEPWWTKIVCGFHFKNPTENFPYADVSVEGRWGAPEYIWCYGNAGGKDAQYSGADFTSFDLKIWVNPTRITLYDISVACQDRKGKCSVEWLYGADGITTYERQKLYLESGLSSAELSALGGKDASDVLDVVRFENPPNLILNAEFRNPENNPQNLPDAIFAQAESTGVTHVECAELENLKFTALSDTINTQILNAKFDFCGGNAEGSLKLKRKEKGMEFFGEVSANKMNQKRFTDFLISLGGDKKTEIENNSSKQKETFGGESGLVDVAASLSGNSEEFEMINGSGYASLVNKDLINLHIFGALSRAFSSLKLPLGSFDIDYANGAFAISEGEVRFSHLELGGPVMLINGSAEYNFLKDNLVAVLSSKPFGAMTNPLIANLTSLINPITDTITIKLNGKFEDPDVSISINPINILQGREKILDKIRDSL